MTNNTSHEPVMLLASTLSPNYAAAKRAFPDLHVVGVATDELLTEALRQIPTETIVCAVIDGHLYPTEVSIRASRDDLLESEKQALALKVAYRLQKQGLLVLVWLLDTQLQAQGLCNEIGLEYVTSSSHYFADDVVCKIRQRMDQRAEHQRDGWGGAWQDLA